MTKVACPLHGLRVLLVEDEYVVAAELAKMLRGLGTVVLGPVGSVEQASKFRMVSYDVALLNVDLHGQPTFPYAEMLMQRGVAIAFVTGYEGETFPGRFRMVPCVEKPVEILALTATMLHLAGREPMVA